MLSEIIAIGSDYVHRGVKRSVNNVHIDNNDLYWLRDTVEAAKAILEDCLSESKERVRKALQALDRPVYAKIALEDVLENETEARKVSRITSHIYRWFYFRFNPFRLIVHNDMRASVAKQFKGEFEALFPWWTFYADADPKTYDYIAIRIATTGKAPEYEKYCKLAMVDNKLKTYIENKVAELRKVQRTCYE